MKPSYVLSAFSLILVACSTDNAVVGGECRSGYTLSGDRCVADDSASNIGNSSGASASSTSQVASTPLGSNTSSSGDPGSTSGGSGSAASSTSSSSSSTSSSGGGSTTPPFIIPDPGSSSSSSSSGSVVVSNPPPSDPVCDENTQACHGACLSFDSDAQNCGACGRSCASNICIQGVCQGATPGDIVVIGHDMSVAPDGSTHAKVFGNAMTLPTTDPLRVLAFEQDADPQTIDRTREITFESTTRSVRLGTATPDMLAAGNLYASWDVVLIDAVNGSNASSYGTQWAESLDTFTKAGGVLVALDNGGGDVPTFLDTTGLINVGMHVALASGTKFVVSAPNDTVGAHLLSPYAAYGTSFGFIGADAPNANLAWVVQSDDNAAYPTVIHKVAR